MNDVMRKPVVTRSPMQIVMETMMHKNLSDGNVLQLALAFIQDEGLLGKFSAYLLKNTKQ